MRNEIVHVGPLGLRPAPVRLPPDPGLRGFGSFFILNKIAPDYRTGAYAAELAETAG